MKQILKKLSLGESLTLEEAKYAMDKVLDNGATYAQIGAYLSLLRQKGETVEEITGSAMMMKEKAMHINPKVSDYIDFVGTGGDGVNTFNITTTAVFITAAAGVSIAQHGNRAVTSKSGSIDLLEKLGINMDVTPKQVEECVDHTGMGFMFARSFNPCMKNASVVRNELGFRTIFNILGPISNPSNAKGQLIGVFDPYMTNTLATAMLTMGVQKGIVVCCNGIDEFTTIGENKVSEIKDGKVIDYMVTPEVFGFQRAEIEDIKGSTPEENAEITKRILSGEEQGAKLDTVLLNAGAGIYIGGKASSIAEGVLMAKELVETGAAQQKLQELITFTNSLKGNKS